jgi:hypothetical protein
MKLIWSTAATSLHALQPQSAAAGPELSHWRRLKHFSEKKKPSERDTNEEQYRAWYIQKPCKLRIRNRITNPKQLIAQSAAHPPLRLLRTRNKENTEHTRHHTDCDFDKKYGETNREKFHNEEIKSDKRSLGLMRQSEWTDMASLSDFANIKMTEDWEWPSKQSARINKISH